MAEAKKKSVSRKKEELAEERWFKRLVLIFVGFLALVVFGAASFIYFYLKGSSAEVKLEFQGPAEIFRGIPFDVDLIVSNDSDRLLNQAEISINHSESVSVLGGLRSAALLTDPVGDMGSGSLVKRTYQFLAAGKGDAEEKISFKFSYLAGGRTRFEVSKDYKVKVKQNAIEFEVEKPAQILPASAFEVKINYKNVSDFDFPEAVLEIQYPPDFKFASASLTPDSLNNYWRLGEVAAGRTGTLGVRGTIQSSSNATLSMPVLFSAVFSGKTYAVAEADVELQLAPPPVETKIFINQREDYVPRIGDRLNYSIQYKNLSGIALADVVIEVELSSDLFDFGSVVSDGNWNPTLRRLVWNASNNPSLRLVDAGGSGAVGFSISLKNTFPINRLNDKNFVLKTTARIVSPSVPSYFQASETQVVSTLESKVAGLVVVNAQGFYRDAESGIINSGLLPPKAGMPTQYSIHWLIFNYSTDIKDVAIKASLPPDVRWTGVVKSNADTAPLYDEATSEVRWSIEKIRATKGVLDAPLEAVFQIEATPDAADIGRFQLLLENTSLRATDEFTGEELTSSDVAINSSLPDDITVGQNGGKVIP